MRKVNSKNYIKAKLAHLHQKASICHHEAGHTILALIHFMNVELVKINYTDFGFVGDMDYFSIFDEKKSLNQDASLLNFNIHSEIIMLYGGLAAEKILFKDNSGSDQFPMVLKNGCEYDIQEIHSLIKKSVNVKPGLERYTFKKQMMKISSRLLRENWEDVKLIAHALFKKNRLNTQELKKILTTKSKNKEYWKSQFKIIHSIFSEPETLDLNFVKITLGIA